MIALQPRRGSDNVEMIANKIDDRCPALIEIEQIFILI